MTILICECSIYGVPRQTSQINYLKATATQTYKYFENI